MHWFYSGSVTKSAGELDSLVNEVLLADNFNVNDLRGFNAKHELNRLDKHTDTGANNFPAADGWRQGSVKIPLPKTKVKHTSEDSAPTFEVHGIFYRPLLTSIKAAYKDASAMQYHNHTATSVPSPSSSYARATTDSDPAHASSPSERLYSKAYNTNTLNRLNDAVQKKAREDREPGDSPSLKYGPARIMMYLDSMHLTNFGTASLWPIYFWLAALSKYVHAMPTMLAAHHLAYIPSLPDLINQEYKNKYGFLLTAAVLLFCKKELTQQIWMLLLDNDFLHAYVHGFVVQCGDGIMRCLFLCILTYSVDYPEKCLIACIKFLGRCPCPDCLVTKDWIHLMGTKRDMATREKKPREDSSWLRNKLEQVRGWIFKRGLPTEGRAVKAVLGSTSTLLNQSAFSRRLGQFGFDIYRALVLDVMHKINLGVWKATMMHLVCIVTTIGQSQINNLNSRYEQQCSAGEDACSLVVF
ncbi:uncharacterized protein TRAVEDRAFT_115985 [Trametes versicolor FP-101664 SS1]|uniref:uncharacterized protein n=1 Tax=Trametes versicolor (strain FP-101664) TaxID=717944 RepID=UPI0004621CCD|nr:uncharacterized protein TRAVEDRAFT_115985 [Trametes versicolor FP-101664 SS1]EIW62284.1 hypothetical protein TRAVEDRAFT_115985 [Trametes versicolor FP-101664 SS1]